MPTTGTTSRPVTETLRRTLGLQPAPELWRDRSFVAALVVGALAAIVLAASAKGGNARLAHASAAYLVGFLIVQPLLEELLFRGVVQGWLRERPWGGKSVFGFSAANGIASLLFVAAHVPAQPLAWALAVSVPSLLFGYFRDRHDSLGPSVVLHVAWNAAFFLGPWSLLQSA